ncbi:MULTISPECIES: 3'(2'),5'-bisphosphate nucleotidase CysQ [unclassified Legionella]|uniref:3'(2'),5'-bisphosphate nucleotidase CysQ family protein n=1 Tax=unclassified Legionella TaxID=2622702 RepID=UPI001055551F|nr:MULTISPECIES: 3'(2'),5'-bisphosphate nucleotidase CysQ [unclassified Legionella]MDI9818374.1 3'(2'),5'-bisphosphate nucleotidase CysQ [Legionella sp. PL877]
MNNIKNYLKKELEVASKFARKGGEIAQEIRTRGYKIHDKGKHLGLVTEADIAVSKMLLQEISLAFPQDIIISEEEPLPEKTTSAKRIWYIDPIDGTKDFIDGSNEWSVMLGLAINGESCLGVVYQPDLERLYFAVKGKGAFLTTSRSTEPLQVKSVSDPIQAVLLQSRSHWSLKVDRIAKQLGISKILRQASIGLKLGTIAEGKADLYFNFSCHCHLWDLCGPEIILREAGGQLFLSSGNNILYTQDVGTQIKEYYLATNKELGSKTSHFLHGV